MLGEGNRERESLSGGVLPWGEAILRTYAIMLFSSQKWVGVVVLGASFLAPKFGLSGLLSVLVAMGGGRLFGFAPEALRDGRYLFNSLLAGLSLAYLLGYYELDWEVLVPLLISVSLLTLFLSVMLSNLVYQLTGLPSMSLPFVVVSMVLFFVFFSVGGIPVVADPPTYLISENVLRLPEMGKAYLQSLGAIFFMPHAVFGLLLAIVLIVNSRLSFLYSLLGFAAGVFFYGSFKQGVTAADLAGVGFNFSLCGVALGGAFFVPSKASAGLVVLGAFFCAVIAIATEVFLFRFGIPPLALPFNLVVLMMVYALRLRTEARHLHPAPLLGSSAEENFREFVASRLKWGTELRPLVALPFSGEWVVTQSFDGQHTHRGQWREALDFEVLGKEGEPSYPAPSARLDDFYTYGTAVNAPVSGTVVRVVDEVDDNAIGEMNLERNWGNTVVIRSLFGWHVALSHLRKEGIHVSENDRVEEGEMIGYCGNSGRSPVPHLHLQVQESDEVGAKTMPFLVKNYYADEKGQVKLFQRELPTKGTRVKPMIAEQDLQRCFEGMTARDFRFQIEEDGDVRMERLEVSVDEWGAWEFRCGAAHLTARIIDGWFQVTSFYGARGTLLDWIWLGLGCFPMQGKGDWRREIDLSPLRSGWAQFLRNLGEPFWGAQTAFLLNKMSFVESGTWEVEMRLEGDRDRKQRITWELQSLGFLKKGMIQWGGRVLKIEQIQDFK